MSEHKKKKHKGGKTKEDRDIKEPKELKEAKKAKPVKDPAAPKATKRAVAKPRAKKSQGTEDRKKQAKPDPTSLVETIALRAYFISESRRANGHHGDEHGDWIEAERQLKAEAKRA